MNESNNRTEKLLHRASPLAYHCAEASSEARERRFMEYRRLGKSGLKVSVVGLGGNNFGNACNEEQSIAVIHRALDDGINLIDTSDSYSHGVSEEHVGKAIAGRRH